jgi:aerobic carbon-monoxide dehydrogenase small subunit
MTEEHVIELILNREPRTFRVKANERLDDVLRRNGCKGVKIGCNEGTCGACTVIVDGRAVNSCLLYAWQAQGCQVQTIEGAGSFEQPHPIQAVFADEAAVQCGYCTPGLIMSLKALLDRDPAPSDEAIKLHLDGNLCRCTGYEKIWTAIKKLQASHG